MIEKEVFTNMSFRIKVTLSDQAKENIMDNKGLVGKKRFITDIKGQASFDLLEILEEFKKSEIEDPQEFFSSQNVTLIIKEEILQ